MKLIFRTYSNGGTLAELELPKEGGYWKNGWFLDGVTQKKIKLGYNMFDTDFYNSELKDIIVHIKTIDDLHFLNLKYTIPTPTILYQSIYERSIRSSDMGLHFKKDLPFAEQLDYYKKHKEDIQKTYIYNCQTYNDVALSELHYYITHGYKFTFCQKCGKPFFTNNLKNKYCKRIGETPHYPNYSCSKVRELERNQKSAMRPTPRKRKIIISNLANKYGDVYGNNVREQFIKDDKVRRQSLSDVEYTHWINEQYKIHVPNGKM